jgi:hypothetical protein
MVTVSDGVMVSRLCASKVRDGRKLGRLHIRHALYPLLLTKQTFIYATAMSALGQNRKWLLPLRSFFPKLSSSINMLLNQAATARSALLNVDRQIRGAYVGMHKRCHAYVAQL